MRKLQVQDVELLSAITTLIEMVREQSRMLHPRSPMTDADIYLYCNKRFAMHKITQAMRNGEIEHCVYLGNKLVALKKHVDCWIDGIFNMEFPGTAAGYIVLPIQPKGNKTHEQSK